MRFARSKRPMNSGYPVVLTHSVSPNQIGQLLCNTKLDLVSAERGADTPLRSFTALPAFLEVVTEL